MNFKKVTGTQEEKPSELDFEGSPGKVYVRSNIKAVDISNDPEQVVMGWEYDEALMTYDEFNSYSHALELQNQAAIDETLAEILLNQLEV